MLSQLVVFAYSIGFFLFGLGLYLVSQSLGSIQFCVVDSFLGGYKISLRAVRFLTGIVIFSAFCNAVLLMPAAAELLFNVQTDVSLCLHRLCVLLLSFCSASLVLLGLLAILKLSGCKCSPLLFKRLARASRPFEPSLIGKKEVIFLLIAIGAYFFGARSPEYVYDTGLYHFPLVNHLVEYGPEIGLANFHSRFAFYNIQLFGQVPLQAFALSKIYVSPSLNILFFSALLMFASDSILSSLGAESKPYLCQSPNFNTVRACIKPISVVSYWFAILVFGLTSKASLISYDSDFSSAIVASLIGFCLATGSFLSIDIILLLACLPLLKLSGIVFEFYAFIFILIVCVCKFAIGNRSKAIPGPRQFKDLLRGMCGWPVAMILFLYVTYFSTNLIVSGYLVFPQYNTGPISSYAVPYADVVNLKDRWITGWARFRFDEEPREIKERAPIQSWLPNFAASSRGKKMLFWIGSSFIAAALSLLGVIFRRSEIQFIPLFASSAAVGFASILVLLLLPPDPRFYAWINGLVVFNLIQLILLACAGCIAVSPAILATETILLKGKRAWSEVSLAPSPRISCFSRSLTKIFLLFGLALSMAILSQATVAIMEMPSLQISSFARGQIVGSWRPRSIQEDLTINISRPTVGDQCWSAPPPCSPYQGFVKHAADAKPAEIR